MRTVKKNHEIKQKPSSTGFTCHIPIVHSFLTLDIITIIDLLHLPFMCLYPTTPSPSLSASSSHSYSDSSCLFQGSLYGGYFYGCCCYPPSWCQISREIKRRAAALSNAQSPSRSSSSSKRWHVPLLFHLSNAHLM